MKKKILSFIILLFALTLYAAAITPNTVSAQALLESTDGANFSDKCLSDGTCQVSDFTILLIRVSQIILGLTGSLSLLAFVYGGTMFLVSSGNKETVEKAKSTLIGAVVGMFIVFASYTIIGFVFKAFQIPGNEQWATSSWFSNR